MRYAETVTSQGIGFVFFYPDGSSDFSLFYYGIIFTEIYNIAIGIIAEVVALIFLYPLPRRTDVVKNRLRGNGFIFFAVDRANMCSRWLLNRALRMAVVRHVNPPPNTHTNTVRNIASIGIVRHYNQKLKGLFSVRPCHAGPVA